MAYPSLDFLDFEALLLEGHEAEIAHLRGWVNWHSEVGGICAYLCGDSIGYVNLSVIVEIVQKTYAVHTRKKAKHCLRTLIEEGRIVTGGELVCLGDSACIEGIDS